MHTQISISIYCPCSFWVLMDVVIGGRPAEIVKDGKEIKVIFHPVATNAKHPKAKMFQIRLSKSDIEVLKKAF